MTTETSREITLCILGSVDFCRRTTSIAETSPFRTETISGSFADGWGLALSHRPEVFILEIGVHHSARSNSGIRDFLTSLRDRMPGAYVVAALLAPERFLFGGELLFGSEETLIPSGFIDTFIVGGPASIPTVPSLREQIHHVLDAFSHERSRRERDLQALPTLNSPGWVQSIADPGSRDLWMKWLPRYASYTNENPLVIGATGTGKTNLAFALHQLSGRSGQFVSITPRDFSSSELVQAELFGAVAGAYTGAVDKWGLVKGAERGTLFIDELQSIDKDLQGKLITFIENKGYRRVGSSERTEADVRFVFASNRSLTEMMDTEVLRDDFAYRLERVRLELRPLRERPLDIGAALAYALAKVRRQRPQTSPISGFSSDAYRILFTHNWPGNLRQLENTIAQLCELAEMSGASLISEQMVLSLFKGRAAGVARTSPEIIARAAQLLAERAAGWERGSLSEGIEHFTELVQTTALEATAGDTSQAAALIEDSVGHLELRSSSLRTRKNLGEAQ